MLKKSWAGSEVRVLIFFTPLRISFRNHDTDHCCHETIVDGVEVLPKSCSTCGPKGKLHNQVWCSSVTDFCDGLH